MAPIALLRQAATPEAQAEGWCEVTAAYPSTRSIQRAIGVLERMPAAALARLAERLIDRLDTVTPDPDLEPEEDDDDDAEEEPLSSGADRVERWQ